VLAGRSGTGISPAGVSDMDVLGHGCWQEIESCVQMPETRRRMRVEPGWADIRISTYFGTTAKKKKNHTYLSCLSNSMTVGYEQCVPMEVGYVYAKRRMDGRK
jgi:hypothetical protein